jgi:hypothetical protein
MPVRSNLAAGFSPARFNLGSMRGRGIPGHNCSKNLPALMNWLTGKHGFQPIPFNAPLYPLLAIGLSLVMLWSK